MKILILNNVGISFFENNSYCESNVGQFAEELSRAGNTVAFFGQRIKVENRGFHTFNLNHLGIEVSGPFRRNNKIVNYLILYCKLIPYIRNSDFIYIFFPGTFNIAAYIAKLYGIRYGIYVRGMKGLTNKLSRWIYYHATVILTVTDYFTNTINAIIQKSVAQTIKPMIPYTYEDIFKSRQYSFNGSLNLLYLGRFDREKGLEELLKAIYYLKEDKQKIHLTLLGDGAFRTNMEIIINDLKLNNWVDLKYGVYDKNIKRDYYLKADAYIIPTYHEGFPRTLYEAMLYGTPIITTLVGGIPSLMKDNVNCKSIDPHSFESIVDGVKFAINHYDMMINYAIDAYKVIEKVLDPNKPSHAKQLLEKIISDE